MKLIDQPKYSSVLSKRSVDSKQKNRRCYEKESTVFSKRIDDAKRKQSIYSQISINCYESRGSNTGQNIVTSQFFHLGFVKLSLCCLPVCGFYNNRSSNALAESFNAKIKLFRTNLRGVADKKFFLFRISKLYAYPH